MQLDLRTIQSPNYDKNSDRGPQITSERCRVCGKAVNMNTALEVHEVEGGGYLATPDEPWGGPADLGIQFIGRDCYRKHKDVLAPYILS